MWRSRLAIGFLGFLAGVIFTNAGVVLTVRKSIVSEQRSPHAFLQTVQTIEKNATERGWKVMHFQDEEIAASAQEPRVEVLELSHPKHTAGLVKHDANRCVAMAPSTIVVYEKEGGVYVAHLNTGLIGRFFRREAAGPMREVRRDEAEILAFLK